jgi:hypothetical protein
LILGKIIHCFCSKIGIKREKGKNGRDIVKEGKEDKVIEEDKEVKSKDFKGFKEVKERKSKGFKEIKEVKVDKETGVRNRDWWDLRDWWEIEENCGGNFRF